MLTLVRWVFDLRRRPCLGGAASGALLAPAVVLWAAVVAAQAPAPAAAAGVPTAPVLTELQQLHLRVALQTIELAQLRAQLAQRDFEQARTRLAALVADAAHPGYELDLATLTFRPTETRKDGGR